MPGVGGRDRIRRIPLRFRIPAQDVAQPPAPTVPGVHETVRVCSTAWHRSAPGPHAPRVRTRFVQGQAAALVPVADRVSELSVAQVCVNASPRHAVDGDGVHAPAQVVQAAALVPVAGRVNELSVEQVCANASPSHAVDGDGVHAPAQVVQAAALVPVAGRVNEASFEQVCVKASPSHAVCVAGPHVPVQVAQAEGFVPVADRVSELSVEQVCANASPRHAVDGAGPHAPPQVGAQFNVPATDSVSVVAVPPHA